MIEFIESGMRFTFPESDCFVIEKDATVVSRCSVKSCECIAMVPHKGRDVFMFIEAKSSAPKSKICDKSLLIYNGTPLDEKWKVKTDFDCFIDDICQKFEDSFAIYRAMEAGWHGADTRRNIPFPRGKIANDNCLFVLIINGFNREWCAPLNDAIRHRLRHFTQSWNIPDLSIKTVNCEDAAACLGIPVTPAVAKA